MTLHLQPDALFSESLAMWVTLRQLPDDADEVSFCRSCISMTPQHGGHGAPQHGAHGAPQPPAPGDDDNDDDHDGTVQLAIARSTAPLS